MVGAQENRVLLRGRVVEISPAHDGWCGLEIEVAEVTPVAGYPTMVHTEPGERLRVLAPEEDVAGVRSREQVKVSVERRSPQDVVARPGTLEPDDDHHTRRPV